jgi:hypothetical protein
MKQHILDGYQKKLFAEQILKALQTTHLSDVPPFSSEADGAKALDLALYLLKSYCDDHSECLVLAIELVDLAKEKANKLMYEKLVRN